MYKFQKNKNTLWNSKMELKNIFCAMVAHHITFECQLPIIMLLEKSKRVSPNSHMWIQSWELESYDVLNIWNKV
jgi:hypothetical protein